jgi:hypothetical protein
MKAAEITEDELHKAIEEYILQSPEPGLEPRTTTTPRMMERFKIGRGKANRILKGLIDDGTIIRDQVSFVNGWGIKTHIPGFRWVNGKDE